MTNPLSLPVEDFRRLGHRAVDLVADYLDGLPGREVFTPMSPETRRSLLAGALPERGRSPDDILAAVAREILPHPMGNGHPRFFGWVNSPPAPLGILGELLAAAMNPSCAGGDHAAIYLERRVVRWLMELVGFPTTASMGLLVSGGSMASLTCLAAARQRATAADGWDVRARGLQGRGPALVLYTSDQGHGCMRKAAEVLGLGGDAVRVVPTDAEFRFDVAALAVAVETDRVAGRRPFCVAASAGTVSTGAIDPLAALADFCAAEGLWLHVDGAYGAFGAADRSMRDAYRGLERADSLALDAHKWLSVPVECGCALVRDGELLRQTFSFVPPYLRTEEGKGFGGLPWYSEYGFQQTRGFRALKLWMTLEQLGREGVEALVAQHRRLAARLAELVEQSSRLELVAPVPLSVVCFRFVPDAAWSEADLDTLNTRIVETVQAEGRAFLTGTVLRGRFALRACVLHYATTEADLAVLVDTVHDAGRRLTAEARR